MTNSIWTWIGGTGAATIAANWTLTAGPGNGLELPQPGDTAIISGGTGEMPRFVDASLSSNVLDLAGNAGATFSNNTTIASNSGLDPLSIIDETGNGTLAIQGPFASLGTIEVTGTNDSLAITLAAGSVAAGSLTNSGQIIVDHDDSLIINIGSSAALFNTGTIVADGGTVVINTSGSALAGGFMPVRGFYDIEDGGTIITADYFPAGDGNNGTHAEYEFTDSTPGNTLKIENIGSFGGVIVDFSAGDTIDLGTSLSVGTISYSEATGFLVLEATNGTTLATLIVGNDGTGFATGTFAVVGGSADGFNFSLGADGDTVITTSNALIATSGTSGAYQSSTTWANGIVPGSTAYPIIGLGATAPFTVNTGNTAVSLGALGIESPFATLDVTSNLTVTVGQIADYAGTVDIATGSTVTAAAVQLYSPQTSITLAAGATLELAGRLNQDLAPIGGTLSLQPGQNPYAFSMSGGTAVIDGALLAGPTETTRGGSVSIGYDSAGQAIMIVNTGGTVTTTHTTIGSDPTSAGTLVVNGGTYSDIIDNADTYNSRGNMTVGYDDLDLNLPSGVTPPPPDGAAQLVIENNATVTDARAFIAENAESAGTVTVSSGGVWNIGLATGGYLAAGDGGQGALFIEAGGTVNAGTLGTFVSNGSLTTGGGIGLGYTGGSGTIVVSGAGALLTSEDGMSVGRGGQALLEIQNGGTVVMLDAGSGMNVGQIAGPAAGTLIVGGSGAAAALDFAAASGSIAAASGMTVGNAAQGTLIVADNGAINLDGTGGLTIGNNAGIMGDVVVGGATAAAIINFATQGISVGNNGTGDLAINSLGTITLNGTGYVTAGVNSGSVGSISVGGGPDNALLTIGTAGLTIGNSGTGYLAIGDNGAVVMSGTGYLTVGSNGGSTGSIVVGGTAAPALLKLTQSGLTVGNNGTGSMTVNRLGTVDLTGTLGTSLVIGSNGGAVGTVTVNGGLIEEGPTSSGVSVGSNGGANGLLSIINSGTVALAGNSLNVANFGANGTVTVQGAGSDLLTTGTAGINVGEGGNGTLTVTAGGVVNDANGLMVGENGSGIALVSVSGGTLTAADITVAQFGNGTVTVQGAGSDLQATGTGGIIVGDGGNGTLTVAAGGAVSATGGIVVGNNGGGVALASVNGGTLTAADITVGQFGNGTLNVTGGGKVFLTTDTASVIGSSATVVGAGSLLQGQTLIIGEANQSTLYVQNSGSVNLALLEIGNANTFDGGGTVAVTGGGEIETGALIVGRNSTLSVDGSSGVDIGTSGSYVAGAVKIESGDTLAGNGLVSANIVDNGVIDAIGGGTLELAGSISGTGSIYLGSESELKLDQLPGATPIVFGSPDGEMLVLNVSSGAISTPLMDLNDGDRIEFAGLTGINGVLVDGSTVTVETNSGNIELTDVSFEAGAQQSFYSWFDGSTGDWAIQVNAPGETWVGGAGTSLGTAANWSSLSVPNSADGLTFNTSGTLTGSATGLDANFNGGPWLLNDATLTVAGAPSPPYQPYALQSNATSLIVNGGSLIGDGSGDVDSATGSAMTIEAGAQVSFEGFGVGDEFDDSGSLLVTGVGTDLLIPFAPVPGGNGGYLNIGGNGGNIGQVTITNGATVNAAGGGSVGFSTGSQGTLTVSAGGVYEDTGLAIASNASGSVGTVTVNGGTIVSGGYGITVGGQGTGVMTVTNGTVTTDGLSIGANYSGSDTGGAGTLSIQSGGLVVDVTNGLNIGQGANGTLVVSGGTLDAATFASVGDSLGGEGIATVGNGGAWLNTQGLSIGDGGSGTLTVGGSITAGGINAGIATADGINVGYNSSANNLLSIEAGGTVVDSGTYTIIGSNSGDTGTVTVSGPGALLNDNAFIVGNDGTGYATVSNGGVVNTTSLAVGQFSYGTLAVSSGGIIHVTASAGENVNVGNASGADGQLSVLAGGTVAVNASYFIIGGDSAGGGLAAAQGTVTVSGTNALLTAATGITVGNNGTGDLQVLNGGSVSLTGAGTGIGIGQGGGSSGTLLVSGGGAMLNLGTATTGIGVGQSGAGTLAIESGGTVALNGTEGIGVGESSGGSGLLLVNGPNSLLTEGPTGSGIGVGQSGAGTVDITNGGSIILNGTANAGMSIGQTAGAQGLVVVSGANSLLELNTPDAGLGIGQVSQGTLEVLSGGTVLLNDGKGMGVGDTAGASGTVVISGAGSSLTTTGTVTGTGITVGDTGTGTLSITSGGALNVGHGLQVGYTSTGSGSVSVTGGTLATGYLLVGSGGSGIVTVGIGGQATIGGLESSYIGSSAGGSGTLVVNGGTVSATAAEFVVGNTNATGNVLVEGGGTLITGGSTAFTDISATGSGQAVITVSGGTWLSGGGMVVGGTGTGTLDIGSGGVVNAGTDDVSVGGANGTINVTAGGTLFTGLLEIADPLDLGVGGVTVSGGGSLLQTSANMLLGGNGALVGGAGSLTVGAGATVDVAGVLSVGLQSTLSMQGGTVRALALVGSPVTSGDRIGGAGTIFASEVIGNPGTIYASAGTLTLDTPAVSSSTPTVLEIDNGGNLAINGAVESAPGSGPDDGTQNVNFAGSGTLTIGDIRQFAPGGIFGFAPGDTIVVDGVSSLTQSFNSATDQLVLTDQVGNTYTLQFSGSLTAGNFTDAVVPGSLSATGAWSSDVSGDFDDPTKWIGGVVPGASTDAIIDFTDQPQVTHDSGNDSVDSVRNIAGDFVMSGGTLTANTVENDSLMSWTGGSLVLNTGTSGLAATASLDNTAAGTLTIAPNGQSLTAAGTGTASLANAGTITVTEASGTANIDVALTNTGEIVLDQGVLSLNGGGSTNAYLLQSTASGTLQFGTEAATGTGGTFTVTGGFYAVANTVVDGSVLDLSAATPITFADSLGVAAGSLILGAQDAADQGAFTQTGGTIAGSGTLTTYGVAALDGGVMTGGGTTQLLFTSTIGGTIALDGGDTLANAGRLNWSSGDIELGAGDPAAAAQSATLANAAGALLYVTADATIAAPGTAAAVTNAGGLVVYAGAGETAIDAALTNTGVIQLQSGTLSLNGGGSSSGSNIFASPGAVLQFGTTAEGGSGTFSITGGLYQVGNTVVDGSTLNLSAASGAVFPDLLSVTAGALSLGALNATDQNVLQQTGGTIAGSGTLTVFGGSALTGGVQTGPGVTVLNGTSTLGGTFALDGGRTLANDGWLNWSSGNIALGSGDVGAVPQAGTLDNASVLYVTADGRLGVGSGGSGVVDNSGVLAVLAGAGVTNIDAALDNTGVVQVQSGTLSLNGGGSSAGSALFVAAGAVLQFGTAASGAGGTFSVTGAAYTVASTVVTGGTLDLAAAAGAGFGTSLSISGSGVVQLGTVTASVGALSLGAGGELAGSGFLFVGGNASLGAGLQTGSGATILTQDAAIGGGADLDGGRTLQNDATLVWSGGTLTLGGGDATLTAHSATLSNVAGAVFAIEADGTVVSAGSGLLANAGTIEKAGGLGVTTVAVAVNNTGTVDVSSGTLAFGQAVSGAGTFVLDGTAVLDLVGGAASGSAMTFLHPGGTLETAALGTFGAVVSGFASGDEIDVAGVGFVSGTTTVGFSGGTLTVSGGGQSASFALAGSYAAGAFTIGSDGHGGTGVTYG